MNEWMKPEYEDTYPFRRERYQTDICHCPDKTGEATLKVIEKQLDRLGFNLYNMVSGTGDGGGENEGSAGVHARLEHKEQGYIRRRCFGHLPWRVAAAGLAEMGREDDTLTSINTYLLDGITWSRLQQIATMPLAAGGLNLFQASSLAFKSVFSPSPPKMMEDRPECTAMFLEWLLPKQQTLATLINKDLSQRDLIKKSSKIAQRSLNSRQESILRYIDYVLLKKSLFLFYYIKDKLRIAEHTTFGALIERAMNIITSASIDDRILSLLRVTRERLNGMNFSGTAHWVENSISTQWGAPPLPRPRCPGPGLRLGGRGGAGEF